MRARGRRTVPAATAVLVVGLAYLAGAFEGLEHRLLDLRYRVVQRAPSGGLTWVGVDPVSLETLDIWPWPRSYHATLLENLSAFGAGAVAFDVDFSSRSEPEEDAAFEQALAAARVPVVLAAFERVQVDGSGRAVSAASLPLIRFRRHARTGVIHVRPDADGLVRRYRVVDVMDGRPNPSFAAALADGHARGEAPFYVDFGIRAEEIPYLSYVDVLSGNFRPDDVRGRVVIVGAAAPELGDHVAVPRYAALPGPLLQALAYESLVQGRLLRRPGPWWTMALLVLGSLGWAAAAGGAGWRRPLAATLSLAGGYGALALAVQSVAPVLLDVVPLTACFALALGVHLARDLDLTAWKLAARTLQLWRTESLMRGVVDSSYDAVLTLDPRGRIRDFNRAAERMFGAEGAEVLGRGLDGLLERVEDGSPVLEPPREPLECLARRRDGTRFPVEVSSHPVYLAGGVHRVCIIRDITERKLHQATLEHQATHDPLTDLPNRNLLARKMRDAVAEARSAASPLAFGVVDLDRFKDINDTLGHPVGDRVLAEVAERLRRAAGEGVFVARIGGDEFAVLLPGHDEADAVRTMGDLVAAVEKPMKVQGVVLHVGGSAGVAIFPDHGEDGERLLQRADVAMFTAKRRRRPVAVYRPEDDFTSMRQLALAGDLRRAISDDALYLVYQPKLCIRTRQVVGVEALVRWRHPAYGEVPPDEFIGLAEQSGVIRLLTPWILEEAVRQWRRWRDTGLDLEMSVNISARNLLEEELPRILEELLERWGMPASRLTLEITESVIMEDPERALAVVKDLDRLGVGISIDDFGTGYSSLGYLKKLPAKEIKIDKSFVMEMDRDPDDALIVRSTVELAHNLGLKVVAEGVERRELLDALRVLDCDYAQGHYFSRPVRAEALESNLRGASPPAQEAPHPAV